MKIDVLGLGKTIEDMGGEIVVREFQFRIFWIGPKIKFYTWKALLNGDKAVQGSWRSLRRPAFGLGFWGIGTYGASIRRSG